MGLQKAGSAQELDAIPIIMFKWYHTFVGQGAEVTVLACPTAKARLTAVDVAVAGLATANKTRTEVRRLAALTTGNDRLVVIIDTHGDLSRTGESEVELHNSAFFAFPYSASQLAEDPSASRRSVVIIGACHSGGFVDALNKRLDPNSCLVLTAASSHGYGVQISDEDTALNNAIHDSLRSDFRNEPFPELGLLFRAAQMRHDSGRPVDAPRVGGSLVTNLHLRWNGGAVDDKV